MLSTLHTGTEGWRIPKWEDDRIWKELYKNNQKINMGKKDGMDNVKLLSGPEDLRDICYEMVLKETASNHRDCNPSWGWCMTCLMDKGWFKTSDDY